MLAENRRGKSWAASDSLPVMCSGWREKRAPNVSYRQCSKRGNKRWGCWQQARNCDEPDLIVDPATAGATVKHLRKKITDICVCISVRQEA